MTVYFPKFLCAGEPRGGGSPGGKAIALARAKILTAADLGPNYLEQKINNHQRVDNLYGDIYSANSLDQLTKFAYRHVTDLFHPDSELLLVPFRQLDKTYSAIERMVAFALKEDTLIYLPDIKDGRAITLEPILDDPDRMFSRPVSDCGADPEILRGMSLRSMVIAPLEVYKSEDDNPQIVGVLVLFSRNKDLLHEYAWVVPLRQYCDVLADVASLLPK